MTLPALASWHSVAITLGLLTYAVTTVALRQRRHPSAAIAWLMAIVLVPYLSLPAFLLFGTRKLPGGAAQAPVNTPVASPLDRLCDTMGLPAPAGYGDFHMHADGARARDTLLAVLDSARDSLVICTYLLADDRLGHDVESRLLAAAARGVDVRLLVDGLGAFGHARIRRRLAAGGVSVARFGAPSSLLRGPHVNLRNHRKFVVADGCRLWAGGRNLADEYFGRAAGGRAWRDMSFDLAGDLAASFVALFDRDWALARREPVPATTPPGRDAAPRPAGPAPARLIPSGPDWQDDTLHAVLVATIASARERVTLVSPYFVPDPGLLDILVLAARSGVAVELHLPQRSNHWSADLARTRALRELQRAGAAIRCTPVMNHAKAVVVDDRLALVGSANLDGRSLFLNFEAMIAIRNPSDVAAVSSALASLTADASPLRLPPVTWWRAFVDGLVLWVAFQL